MNARRLTTLIALLILAFASGLWLARLWSGAESGAAAPATVQATVLRPPRELPALGLVGDDGRPLESAALQDRWTLVFFGFTRCPDVCPTTLATLAQVQRLLADLPTAQRPGVLLITVDPEHDTPAVLQAYVRHFDPGFRAATGSPEAVQAVASAFGVPFAKVDAGDGEYTMDHGSGLFIVDPKGRLSAFTSAPHVPATIAADFRAVAGLGTGERS